MELGVCGPAHKPKELLYNPAKESTLCGEKGQGVVGKGEAKVGRGEEGDGTSACAVRADIACVENRANEIEVLMLVVQTCCGVGGDGHRGHGRRSSAMGGKSALFGSADASPRL